ncbi:MAG: pilus assembly protein PilM [Minisyncoccia bacterium]
MFKNTNKSFLSTPIFRGNSSFGLDISDESIKFIELIKTKEGLRVGKYGEYKIPAGVIEAGEIIEPVFLEKILIDLRKKEGIKSAYISLPEKQIHILRLKLDKSGSKNIKKGIENALEYNISMSAQNFVFDFKLLNETKQIWDVQVVVILKNIMDGYASVFKNSKIFVLSFESKAQALARATLEKGDLETCMIVDLGVESTTISIVSGRVVVLDSSFDMGGSMFVDRAHVLRDEISKHFLHWCVYKDEEDKGRPIITKIILCGGGLNLIGLAEYLSAGLKNKVEVANVWTNIVDTDKFIPEIDFKQSLTFATALGLALKGFK